MPSNLIRCSTDLSSSSYSETLAELIKAQNFSRCATTVVGYGNMGRQYVQALMDLGVENIRVVSRSAESLKELESSNRVTTQSGGYDQIQHISQMNENAIVCTPIDQLVNVARHLGGCEIRNMLIEKPVSLHSKEILLLHKDLANLNSEAFCAYNRTSYPTVLEAKALCDSEGGITSCNYTFTEFVDKVENGNFNAPEMSRWGIANSLHVMSLAHSVIGMPKSWNCQRSGSLVWHPSGSVFVGSGISESGVPFSYHADWGSTGRWSVEFHTSKSSYKLCPLEQLTRRDKPTGGWEPVTVATYSSGVKYGILEQVAAFLNVKVRETCPLTTLDQAAELTEFGESIFGY